MCPLERAGERDPLLTGGRKDGGSRTQEPILASPRLAAERISLFCPAEIDGDR